MAARMTLTAWAEQQFGDAAPKLKTLQVWARSGQILPLPEKIGRSWFVLACANYFALPEEEKEKRKAEREGQQQESQATHANQHDDSAAFQLGAPPTESQKTGPAKSRKPLTERISMR